ncbi:MAG: DUF4198 domain-containing protein [Alphaproteobacteria bacterium]|nr:DUF4198 domain-containing protein [Alphaproteobacteria bacterium]
MRIALSAFIVLLWVTSAGQVLSHEFWIAPVRYAVEPGERIMAALRVGQKFAGSTNAYLPGNFARFDVILGGVTLKVEGRLGDDPALQMKAPNAGLAVIVHQTTKSNVRYTKWEKFGKFARHKGFADVLATHQARGLPEVNFLERYRRFAKSLVAVGHGRGQDGPVGLETEFVAEANPYTDALEAGFPVRLLYQAKPRANTQVEVFEKAPDGTVSVRLLKTNAEGRVLVPAQAGYEYLLDAVVIRPLEAKKTRSDPVWETLWAQFTYRVPAAP